MPFDNTKLPEANEAVIAEQVAEPRLWPIYAGLLIFVLAIAASVATFGVPGLYIPALALVPVMYVMLIWISRG